VLVTSILLGAKPPVDFRAVCFVLAILVASEVRLNRTSWSGLVWIWSGPGPFFVHARLGFCTSGIVETSLFCTKELMRCRPITKHFKTGNKQTEAISLSEQTEAISFGKADFSVPRKLLSNGIKVQVVAGLLKAPAVTPPKQEGGRNRSSSPQDSKKDSFGNPKSEENQQTTLTRSTGQDSAVYLRQSFLKKHDIYPGDLLFVWNRQSSKGGLAVGIATPTLKLQDNSICLDHVTRQNCGVSQSSDVVISPVHRVQPLILEAESIQLRFCQPLLSPFEKESLQILQRLICQQLTGQHLVVSNSVWVSIYARTYQLEVLDWKPKAGELKAVISTVSGIPLDSEGQRELSQHYINDLAFVVTSGTQADVIWPKSEVSATAPKEDGIGYHSIGGLTAEIEEIREVIDLSFYNSELLKEYGLSAPKGILLHGNPGTGKTLIAKAVANECGASIVVINGPEFISSDLGKSEEKLSSIFHSAESSLPALIFFDELDAVCGIKAESQDDMEKRIVATLVNLMDNSPAGLLVIGLPSIYVFRS